jgi:hypothetical protein
MRTLSSSGFSKVPRFLNKPPWMGVVWDGSNMVIGEKNQNVAVGLILWMTNYDPNETKYGESDLTRKLTEILNKVPAEVVLPGGLF